MNPDDLNTYFRIKKQLDERIKKILEYYPARFDAHYVYCKSGGGVEVPGFPVKRWEIYEDWDGKGQHVVYVTLGPPSGYEGETHSHFPIEWVLLDKTFQQKIWAFKRKHDKLQTRVNKEHIEELEKEREKKIQEFMEKGGG